MSVNSLVLFKNVKITRDYSTVHDLTPTQWFEYLMNVNNVQSGDPSPPVEVYRNLINYYRLPDTIRIEANYDDIRAATYGCLVGANEPGLQKSFGYLFFWVDSVRLVRQHVAADEVETKVLDTVELSVSPDIWSNKFTDCQLYDTFIARRHEDRWYRDHTDPDDPSAWVYHPRYFPNAADDVGGAYQPEVGRTLLNKVYRDGSNVPYSSFFVLVCALTESGHMNVWICPGLRNMNTGEIVSDLLLVRTGAYAGSRVLIDVADALDGDLWSFTGESAKTAQSILVTPYLDGIDFLWDSVHSRFYIDYDTMHAKGYSSMLQNYGGMDRELIFQDYVEDFSGGIFESVYVMPSVKKPVLNDPAAETTYSDNHEPMLFMTPARQRKIVTGMGGTVLDIPDISAFASRITMQNIVELASGAVAVIANDGDSDIVTANAKGAVGVTDLATLPIYESAWATYNAIQKSGDDIAFNAKQVQSAVGIATGAAGGAAVGALTTGNPVGAIAGGIGGVVSGAVGMWSNSENLRAKRETIKNSPCTVVTTGSGLTGVAKGYSDLYYITLRLEDVSYNKLRTQYYYYGYNVNMVIPGIINTKVRKYFDYIETRGARIKGNVNAEEAQGIAAAFDRGVRIYHGSDGYKRIGAGMSLENPERAFL